MSDVGGGPGSDVLDAPIADAAHGSAWAWRRIVGGAVAALAWGLFFDQLTRVGGWVLDTYNVQIQPPLLDLHSRYRDAITIWHHGHLYGYRRGAFTYPPVTGYLFLPFHAIGWRATAVVWTIGNVVALALLLTVVLQRYFSVAGPTAWLVSATGLAPATIAVLFPFHSLLYWGQLSLFLLVVVFVDLVVVPPRYRGLLIGAAAAVKLLPALFVVWLLARREFGAVARAGAAFLVLTLVAAALWPHASDVYWLHLLPSGQDVLMVANPTHQPTAHGLWYFGVGKIDNQSLRGLLGRPPFTWIGTFPWILVALGVLAVGVAATIRLLGQRRELLAFVVLSCTTVLVSPVSWAHYWVFVVLAPFVAVLEWRRDRVLVVASLILTVATCVDVEDPRLDSLYFVGAKFSQVAKPELFVVRNCYVLGGLVFLGLVAWRAFRGEPVSTAPDAGSAAAAPARAASSLSPATP
jgi:alpha-1,2-mannosyltransferase